MTFVVNRVVYSWLLQNALSKCGGINQKICDVGLTQTTLNVSNVIVEENNK